MIYELIVNKMYGNLSAKKIAILGFAFKANTNDTRESASIDICSYLLNEGAILKINDPKVSNKLIYKSLQANSIIDSEIKNNLKEKYSFHENIYETIYDCDAIVILTEWDEYKELDWDKIANITRKPTWVFDTRLILDMKNSSSEKINFWQLGVGN